MQSSVEVGGGFPMPDVMAVNDVFTSFTSFTSQQDTQIVIKSCQIRERPILLP